MSVRRLLIWVALYAAPVSAIMRPVSDYDIWWHLRTGQWVVEHAAVPTTDPFSSYGEGRPWAAYSWLFEVLVYGLHQALGLTGVLIYRIVFSVLVLAVLHRFVVQHEPRFLLATVLVALVFISFWGLLNERPWLFSILFCTLTLEAILDLRAGTATRKVWLLPIAYALWANLHILFVYGLAFLALACVAPVIDRALRRPTSGVGADTLGTRRWWALVGLSAACAAATLVNPYHVRLYKVVFEYATQPVAYELIIELQALQFRHLHDWALLGLFALAAFSLGRRANVSAFDVLLLAGTAYVSFRSRRDMWFVVLGALGVLMTMPRPAAAFERRFTAPRGAALVVAAGVLLMIVGVGWHHQLSEQRMARAVAEQFPEEAAAFVREQGLTGPLFNDVDWGGYLIWRLPELKVPIDNRMNLHGDERLGRHVKTCHGISNQHDPDLTAAGVWLQDDPDLNKARVVIVRSDGPLPGLLAADPRFREAHKDPVATVFVARDP